MEWSDETRGWVLGQFCGTNEKLEHFYIREKY